MPAPARKPRLVVDTHVRVAAWLHIALALLTLGFVCVVAFGLSSFSFWGQGVHNERLFFGVFGVVLLGLGIFPILEIVGAAKLLGGKPSGRIITMVFSVIHLLNFPVGSAVCVYSFWVLLRDPPKPARGPAPAGDARPASGGASPTLRVGETPSAAMRTRPSTSSAALSRVPPAAGASSVSGALPRTTAGARPPGAVRPQTRAGTRSLAATGARSATSAPIAAPAAATAATRATTAPSASSARPPSLAAPRSSTAPDARHPATGAARSPATSVPRPPTPSTAVPRPPMAAPGARLPATTQSPVPASVHVAAAADAQPADFAPTRPLEFTDLTSVAAAPAARAPSTSRPPLRPDAKPRS